MEAKVYHGSANGCRCGCKGMYYYDADTFLFEMLKTMNGKKVRVEIGGYEMKKGGVICYVDLIHNGHVVSFYIRPGQEGGQGA
jgi:hypothetical protein